MNIDDDERAGFMETSKMQSESGFENIVKYERAVGDEHRSS